MARILCAWEYGGDLGHVRRIVPIAQHLRGLGHEVTMAFRDSAFIESARAEGFETFIAPLLKLQPEMNPSPLNYSDVLLNLGYRDVRGVAGALRAWQSLFELLKPDVLVAEYAPTALIAALLARIRRVTVSAGFSVPVFRDPMPDLRAWQPSDPNILRALDDRLLTTVRLAAGSKAQLLPERAHALFHAHAHLLCTFREIDPFGPRDGVEYLGPPQDSVGGVDVAWLRESAPHVFAYLKPRSARFDAVMAALASLDAEVIVAAPGLTPERAGALSTASMRVLPVAVNLEVLRGASLCVCHAGAGVPARAMAAGVPLALLPLQLDQFLMALRIEQTGAAVVSNPEQPPPEFRAWFNDVLTETRFREAAMRLRETLGTHDFGRAAARTAERIAEVAQG
jgi:UDP:flavonoid glycosyltransferase YjiC (YdhE family)